MLTNVTGWIAQPFSEDMDVWKWCLFLVVMLTVAVLWLQVLRYITEE